MTSVRIKFWRETVRIPEGGKRRAQWIAYSLLTQQPGVWILALGVLIQSLLSNRLLCTTQRESKQLLVDLTQPVLYSGKLYCKKVRNLSELTLPFYEDSYGRTYVLNHIKIYSTPLSLSKWLEKKTSAVIVAKSVLEHVPNDPDAVGLIPTWCWAFFLLTIW